MIITTHNKLKLIIICVIIVLAIIYFYSLYIYGKGQLPHAYTMISCDSWFSCNGLVSNQNGTISFMIEQTGYNAIYDVEFACVEPAANVTNFLNRTIEFTNITMVNGTDVKVTNIHCYDYSNQPVKNFTALYYGTLWLIYRTSPSSSHIYDNAGVVEVARQST